MRGEFRLHQFTRALSPSFNLFILLFSNEKMIHVPQPCPGKDSKSSNELVFYTIFYRYLLWITLIPPSVIHFHPCHQILRPRKRAGSEGHRSRNRRWRRRGRQAPDSCGGRPPSCHSMCFQLWWPDHLESSSLGLTMARLRPYEKTLSHTLSTSSEIYGDLEMEHLESRLI